MNFASRTGAARLLRGVSLGLVLSLGAMSLPLPAFAQTPAELAKARTLYKQGLSLEAAGDWGGALAKFEEVGRVKLTPQVRFHIARCKENLGRLTEALGDYRLAEYEAQQQDAKELGEITKAREGLEARIPKLVLARGAGAEAARIELDGVDVGEPQVGKEIPVNPGPHKIIVKLSGNRQFEETVTVAEGETKNVELVPPPELLAGGATTPPDEGGSGDDVKPPPDVSVEKSGPGALPWIIGGVGIVSLGAAGFFAYKRSEAESDLEDVCRGEFCPRSKESLQEDGERYALFTNIAAGVGIAAVGTAVVLLIAGGGSSSPKQESVAKRGLISDVRVDVGTGSFRGVNVVGRF